MVLHGLLYWIKMDLFCLDMADPNLGNHSNVGTRGTCTLITPYRYSKAPELSMVGDIRAALAPYRDLWKVTRHIRGWICCQLIVGVSRSCFTHSSIQGNHVSVGSRFSFPCSRGFAKNHCIENQILFHGSSRSSQGRTVQQRSWKWVEMDGKNQKIKLFKGSQGQNLYEINAYYTKILVLTQCYHHADLPRDNKTYVHMEPQQEKPSKRIWKRSWPYIVGSNIQNGFMILKHSSLHAFNLFVMPLCMHQDSQAFEIANDASIYLRVLPAKWL
ncbi:hypothetical protein VNO77_18770 [Canavalia gladiata]|uniref:Uncharacterized protein n=1 Tax=Canavalia gladiata TaxID=3824 RepID=A0AAN9LPW2_CANGL